MRKKESTARAQHDPTHPAGRSGCSYEDDWLLSRELSWILSPRFVSRYENCTAVRVSSQLSLDYSSTAAQQSAVSCGAPGTWYDARDSSGACGLAEQLRPSRICTAVPTININSTAVPYARRRSLAAAAVARATFGRRRRSPAVARSLARSLVRPPSLARRHSCYK